MLGIKRLSPLLVRPLARKPHTTIKLFIKQTGRSSSHTSVCSSTSLFVFNHSHHTKVLKGGSILPFGPYGSLIKPALFTVGVISGSIFLAGTTPTSHIPHLTLLTLQIISFFHTRLVPLLSYCTLRLVQSLFSHHSSRVCCSKEIHLEGHSK